MYPAGFEPAMFAPTGLAPQASGFDQAPHTDTNALCNNVSQLLKVFGYRPEGIRTLGQGNPLRRLEASRLIQAWLQAFDEWA
jgi:hypothetical protein